jgi:hypothetical protein
MEASVERIIRYSTKPHPEDHKPGHCDCSCFGRGFTIRHDGEGPTAFGRVVARDDENVYIDWFEVYGSGDEPENWHADPWPLTLFTEITRG